MRTARIVEEGAGYYPVISRVVGREFVFAADAERERFRAIMRAVEAGAAHYRIMSRVGDRRYVFDEGERERIRKTVRISINLPTCSRSCTLITELLNINLQIMKCFVL